MTSEPLSSGGQASLFDLEDALRLRDVFGFRGGLSGEERAARLPRWSSTPTPVEADRVLALSGWKTSSIALAVGLDAETVRKVLRAHRKEPAA